jgi:hypothetical protein
MAGRRCGGRPPRPGAGWVRSPAVPAGAGRWPRAGLGHQLDGLVDAPGAFHVHRQRVQKDVGQGVAGNLGQRRVAVGVCRWASSWARACARRPPPACARRPGGWPASHRVRTGAWSRHQSTRCGPLMGNCSVAGKHKRNGAGGQQMRVRDACRGRKRWLRTQGCKRLVALEKSDVVARAVARCRHGQRLHVATSNQLRQRSSGTNRGQQLQQGCVVQQRARLDAGATWPAASPATAASASLAPERSMPDESGAVHLVRRGSCARPGRSAARWHRNCRHHRPVADALMAPAEVPVMMGKGLGSCPPALQLSDVGNGLEHAHLVGGACATTGQQQTGRRGVGLGSTWPCIMRMEWAG